MRNPRITVAMTMYNSSRYLRECIDSILSQTMTDFELLIVDDGSTDDSCEIIESYSDSRIRLIKRHHDFVSSLNTLLSESRGEYIARMDSDDIMQKERLQIESDYLDSHKEVSAVCSCAIGIDPSGKATGKLGHTKDLTQITLRMMAEGNCVCNPSAMLRKETMVKKGLRYNPRYCYAEDYRFWVDLLLAGGRIDLIPENLIKYRRSCGQVTQRHWKKMKACADSIRDDLMDKLIELANPGYVQPVPENKGHRLTLIIPFLNEGEEVEKTINSFQSLAHDKVDIIVINDASYDSYPYMERLNSLKGVTYILNRKRLGVAGCRDKGVDLCTTPYFLLLDAHMRAYDDLWVTEIPLLLDRDDNTILCCQSRPLRRDENGNVIPDITVPQSFGARLTFTPGSLMPGIEWISEEKDPENTQETIPAVLGAGYAASRRFWKVIGGLKGLEFFGFDEQLISLKTWLVGGKCVLMKNLLLGHIYRDTMPYAFIPDSYYHNSMFITELLFPFKARCAARSGMWIRDKHRFMKTIQLILSQKHDFLKNRERWVSHNVSVFEDIVNMNRMCTSLERTIEQDISFRIPEVYSYILSNLPSESGLYNGKLAYSIWLFHYAETYDNKHASDLAHRLLSEASEETDLDNLSFDTGLTGLIWSIRYLTQNNFITSRILSPEIYERELYAKTPVSITDKNNPEDCVGLLHALIIRISQQEGNLIPDNVTKVADKVAINILRDSKDFRHVYVAMLWKELRGDIGNISESKFFFTMGLTDWIKPVNFISQNSKFWKTSLRDGVLAATITRLINQKICNEKTEQIHLSDRER